MIPIHPIGDQCLPLCEQEDVATRRDESDPPRQADLPQYNVAWWEDGASRIMRRLHAGEISQVHAAGVLYRYLKAVASIAKRAEENNRRYEVQLNALVENTLDDAGKP